MSYGNDPLTVFSMGTVQPTVTGTVHLICDHNWRLAEIRPLFNKYRTNMLGREAIFYCSHCLDWHTRPLPEPPEGG